MLCKPPHKGDLRACSSVGSPTLLVREVEDKFFDRQKAAALELGDQGAAHANLSVEVGGCGSTGRSACVMPRCDGLPTIFLSWPTTGCSRVNHTGSQADKRRDFECTHYSPPKVGLANQLVIPPSG